MLGVFLAALSAATFAFNNASARRGVLTGSVAQALAITVPIGVPIFFLAVLATGHLGSLAHLLRRGDRPAGIGRRAALRGRALRQFPRRAGDRRQSGGAGDPAQPRGHPRARDHGAERDADPAAHARHRAAGAWAHAHGQRRGRQRAAATPSKLPKFVPRYAEGYAFALLAALVYGVTPFSFGWG